VFASIDFDSNIRVWVEKNDRMTAQRV